MNEQQPAGEAQSNLKKSFYKRWWFIAITVVVFLMIVSSFGEDKSKKEAKQEESKTENQQIETVSETEIPESTYEARISSEGEKISKAAAYIMQAGTFLDSKDYDTYDDLLYKASSEFKSVKWTFEGQKNPPSKYKSFNENMINIFSDIVDTVENDLTIAGITTDDGKSVNKTKFNVAISKLTKLTDKANNEMTKAGF